jgi:two-component system response regulator NreC
MITVVLAEDHQALIDGIKLFLEYEDDITIVGEANDGEALIDLVLTKKPQIVITDIRMPKCDGIQATKIIKKVLPETKVIAFSMFEQEEAITQMRDAGASGYIMKNASLKTMVEAVKTVARGDTFFDTSLPKPSQREENQVYISPREKEILQLITQGKSSQEIADALFVSKSTIDTHRKNMVRKLGLQGKSELLRYAMDKKYDF